MGCKTEGTSRSIRAPVPSPALNGPPSTKADSIKAPRWSAVGFVDQQAPMNSVWIG